MCSRPTVKHFFHKDSFTCSFLVYDPATKDAVAIDTVMDLDTVNWQVSLTFAHEIAAFIDSEQLRLRYVLDTHTHADHITGAQFFKRRYGAPYCIGANITHVQATFAGLFGLANFAANGSQFDRLLQPDEELAAGSLTVKALLTPGHTPNCMSYVIGDAVFTGDAIFMEDFGTGRCDFPGGSAEHLYESIQRLFSLPTTTRVFVGHDYQPGGRELRVETTMDAERERNEDITVRSTRDEFVAMKKKWDATLNFPKLIFPSLLVNMNGGVLPPRHANGNRYFVIPMNLKGDVDDIGMPLAAATA
jgi:glyoxylase-like metal-dependent hydrolase (beta-lactamase superfamily II)